MSGLAWLVAIILAVPLGVLCLELIAGLFPSAPAAASGRQVATAILIPAHDEESGISATIEELRAVAPPGTRILVVADNCTDGTATKARAAGVEVVERHDPTHRGKGYALAFGRDHLAATNHPEVVIVLDADCRLASGSVETLAHHASLRGAPAQAINLITPNLAAAPMVQFSSFAMLVKNLYRSRGMQRLGGAALLTGTGMAFPWALFANADLATGSIVEDLSLGIEMTRAGHVPLLVSQAQVRSAPAAMADALQQRKRWEHGFLETMRSSGLPVLGHGLRHRSLTEILLGLHLLVPPLALLLMLGAVGSLILALLAALGASWLPFFVLAALVVTVLASVGVAWAAGGRPFMAARTLATAPLYLLWKIPIYVGFIRKPQASWVRTPRGPE